MVIAVTDVNETSEHDLKSLAGAHVTLRRLTYGQMVERRAMMKLSIDASGRGKNRDFKGEMAMASKEIQRFEFKNAIVDHNLEKSDGVKLDLGSSVDFEILDPRVGQEIESLIQEMNNFDEDDQEN